MILSLTILAAFSFSLVVTYFMESVTTTVPVIGSFVRLQLTHNPHIAFGIAFPPILQTTLIAAALIAVCVVAFRAKEMMARVAFGLIIGGAFANVLDRFLDGFVTDYIAVGTFPVFNAPDICISIGAGMLIVEGLRSGKRN